MTNQDLRHLANDAIEYLVDSSASYSKDHEHDQNKEVVARNRLLTLVAAMIEAPPEVRREHLARFGHLHWCDIWGEGYCSTGGLCDAR